MEPVSLFYKEHVFKGDEVEIFFHKDFTYKLNEAPGFPVIKFTLVNCSNTEEIKFEKIDFYNDGVTIEIINEERKVIFRTTDMGGINTKLYCEKVNTQELEYRQSDLVDIIKSLTKDCNENNERVNILNHRIEGLKNTLTHDLDNMRRKYVQASWLPSEKKHFLEGQIMMIERVLELLKKG
jgi:hypothetical protein